VEENKELLVCPICDTVSKRKDTYCSGCGFEFIGKQEGAGPMKFRYRVAESAYIPSGKNTKQGTSMMISSGLAAAVVAGTVGFLLEWGFGSIILSVGCGGLIGIIASVILLGATPGLIGYLIAYTVSQVAIRGKSRDLAQIKKIGLILGLIGYLSFLLVNYLAWKENTFNSLVDWIKQIWHFMLITGVAWGVSGESLRKKPFCESCNEYMIEQEIGKWPIKNERTLIQKLRTQDFSEIEELSSQAAGKNYTTLSMFYCPNCAQEDGYLNAITTLTRINYKNNPPNEYSMRQMVFSGKLNAEEVNKLLQVKTQVAQIQ
jgi:hypothetical protein